MAKGSKEGAETEKARRDEVEETEEKTKKSGRKATCKHCGAEGKSERSTIHNDGCDYRPGVTKYF